MDQESTQSIFNFLKMAVAIIVPAFIILVMILPQAVRILLPPSTGDFIALFKDTSVCSVVAVVELTGGYRQLVVANPGQILYLAGMTALLYLLMSYPLSMLSRRLEKRFPKVVV